MVNHLHRLTLFLRFLGVLALVLSQGIIVVHAQDAASAKLISPKTDAFPTISAYLDVRDSQGNFVNNLKPAQLSIMEDGHALQATELTEVKAGAQFVVAFNMGLDLALRNGEGVSRYDTIYAALKSWAESKPASSVSDDLSLLINDTPGALHMKDKLAWLSALEAYQSDPRAATPSLEVLEQAIDAAAEAASGPGMGRAVLFITPQPDNIMAVGLQNLAGRAISQGVRIFVWMVATPDMFTSPLAKPLQDLAAKTHGQFLGFSGVEILPDLETYLDPLRSTYLLSYHSQISTPGVHQLLAKVQVGEAQATTTPVSFEVNIEPPSVMFISPPAQITRSPSEEKENAGVLYPLTQPLNILVEFPDGFVRPIITSTLYVDGAVASINKIPPFDKFTWDLSSYMAAGSHKIRAEIVDSQGLRTASMDTIVQVDVKITPQNALAGIASQGPVLAGLAVVLAGAVLGLVLILGGRIRPRTFGRGEPKRIQAQAGKETEHIDPLSQPVDVSAPESSHPRRSGWFNPFLRGQRHVTPKALAYLVRMAENEEEVATAPIPLIDDEIGLGRDHVRARIAIDDPSVEPLHAWLRKSGSTYRLSDDGSVAGTWVNYTPISSEGVLLENGDLVHIGRVGFRFNLKEPEHTRKLVILPEEQTL